MHLDLARWQTQWGWGNKINLIFFYNKIHFFTHSLYKSLFFETHYSMFKHRKQVVKKSEEALSNIIKLHESKLEASMVKDRTALKYGHFE